MIYCIPDNKPGKVPSRLPSQDACRTNRAHICHKPEDTKERKGRNTKPELTVSFKEGKGSHTILNEIVKQETPVIRKLMSLKHILTAGKKLSHCKLPLSPFLKQ